VGKIAPLPDNQSMWMNPDLKVYNTEIWLDGDAQGLRAGMSCRAEIIVAQYENAVYVPVHTVVRDKYEKTCVFLVNGSGNLEKREVEIGLDNNRMVHILSGLKKGDIVTEKPDLTEGTMLGTKTPETIKPAEKEAIPEEDATPTKPATKADGEGDGSKVQSVTPEERTKATESTTPEQRTETPRRRTPRGNRGGAAGQD